MKIKDSGERTEFETGAVRDMHAGKGRMDLLPWKALLAVSKHCEEGALKYGERNCEKGIPIHSLIDSAFRHLASYMEGWDDEPHLRAASWNILFALQMELTRPELQDIPSRNKNKVRGERVTNQEKKTWLRRYSDLNMEIECLRSELVMWHEKALNISLTVGDNTKFEGERNLIQDVIENVVCLEDEITQKIEKLFVFRNEILETIKKIKDPRLRNLLHYRYILCLTWEDIAKKMNISLRWVYRKHGQALKEILI